MINNEKLNSLHDLLIERNYLQCLITRLNEDKLRFVFSGDFTISDDKQYYIPRLLESLSCKADEYILREIAIIERKISAIV